MFILAACTAVSSSGLTYGNLVWGALMQVAVPQEMLARVASVDYLFSISLPPLGILAAGVLVGPLGVSGTVLIGAALSAVTCLVVLAPGVRDPDKPDYAPVPG